MALSAVVLVGVVLREVGVAWLWLFLMGEGLALAEGGGVWVARVGALCGEVGKIF